METQSNVNRLAGYILKLGMLAAIVLFCWYFSSVLIYVILAFVVSLIGQPLMRLMRKVRVKGRGAPDWLLAILCIAVIFAGMLLVLTQVFPVITMIFRDASIFSNMKMPDGNFLDKINGWISAVIPGVEIGSDALGKALDYLKTVASDISLTGIIGSVASMVTSLAVGLFSVAFISFFFIKDEALFVKIVAALTPDRVEPSVKAAIGDIEHLLSRYFVGLIIEMTGVALVDFLGLWAIARIDFVYAVGIAFLAGILNIIPYVGPLIGEVLGVLLCVVLKYGAGVGLDVNIWVFAGIVLVIMLAAQLIDNFVYQPLIYSTSIQATPLEIFIVILMAGHIGGAVGMLAAIPAYTVLRVVASRFLPENKIVKRLINNS
ncbi:MAG: AI-2E family transporter [Bacteroidales bacterium]|nr:AI-2E family transporter [Bacteroidales bacterium]